LLNDGIWNAPAPRPGGAPRLTFAALPPQELPQAWWNAAPDAVALPTNPILHQPLLDWLVPASNGPAALALPHAVAFSQDAWNAFLMPGLFDFDEWDLALWRSSP
jgi:hypothetical protein